MNPRRRPLRILALILVMTGLAITASQLFRPLRDAEGFFVPSPGEAARAQQRFAAALAGEGGAPEGLQAGPFEGAGGVIALVEKEEDCRGRGSYLLRPEAELPLALVAPHRGSDRNTGRLAELLFAEMPAAAAAWNSAPRRAGADCPGGDPVRHETHYLTAFSLGFAERHPEGRIVQLHGFERSRRESSAAQLAQMIVSAGTEEPDIALFGLADCLSIGFAPSVVAVYPNDVAELGALTNRQGQALRERGFTGFVHLEISAELRSRLVRDAELRGRLATCLAEGLR